jgi:predicted nucleic acid-binding protein
VILVDSCILIDIHGGAPRWREWSVAAITAAADRDDLAINPVVYAEIAVGTSDRRRFDHALRELVWLPISRDVAWRAARAHSDYLARGGKRRKILGDFWIGAHAEVDRLALLTRNPGDYRQFQIPEVLSP